jgi:hypothetical protein
MRPLAKRTPKDYSKTSPTDGEKYKKNALTSQGVFENISGAERING